MNSQTSLRWHLIFDQRRFFGSLLLGIAGGAAGGFFAGIIGRGSMRVVALLAGATPSFSTDGTFFVILSGMIVGVFGGLVFALLLPLLPGTFNNQWC